MRRNNSAPASEPPIDWLAEFDSEPESPDSMERPEDVGLSMFPSELVESAQPTREPDPLLHVVPLGPPTGPQVRYGEYLGSEPSFAGRVLARWDQSASRLPQFRDSALALLRRRRKVFGATAAILVISTAATAGSLAVRRWQRPPERVADQRADTGPGTDTQVDAATPVPTAGTALFGASAASSPVPAPTHTPPPAAAAAPTATNVITAPKPSPVQARTSPALTPGASSASAISSVATATRPAVTPASTAAPISISTPTPIATATPTLTPTPTPTPAAPPRPTPAAAAATVREETKTTAEPAPVSGAAADRSAIQYVLNRYRQTFDSLSVDDVAGFWPSVNIRSLSRAFDQLSSQELTFDGCTIDLRDTLADATCRGRVKYVPKVGSHSPRADNHQWTFLLQRATAGWTIVRVDVK